MTPHRSRTSLGSILKRDGSQVPFDEEKIAVAVYKAFASLGVHDRPRADALAAEVRTALEATYGASPPTVEDIQDVVEDVLIRHGECAAAKAYIIYRFKRGQVRARKAGRRRDAEPIPYKVLWRYFVWNTEHGVETTDKLNAVVREGRFPELVASSDRRYEDQVRRAAEEIEANRNELRVVIVAGPSSSGKTTTTLKLGGYLREMGLTLRPLALDNYFFDLELHPRDASGDYDFETPEALDLPLIREHLTRLLEGDAVDVPFYDFKAGRRTGRRTPLRLASDEILVLDCLHGLFDELSGALPLESKFRVYIETLEQMKTPGGEFLRWTDIRLLRRMIRDHLHRAYDPRKTLLHWHYVRRSEMKHIIPFVHDVDFVVNSSLPYELPVLGSLLHRSVAGLAEAFRDDPRHRDAFLRARRLDDLLSCVEKVSDHGVVPADSLLREFIGGSAYDV